MNHPSDFMWFVCFIWYGQPLYTPNTPPAMSRHHQHCSQLVYVWFHCPCSISISSPNIIAGYKSAKFNHLRISLIRKYLTPDVTKIIVHFLVSFRLDYCNSILFASSNSKWANCECALTVLHAQLPYSTHATFFICPLLQIDITQIKDKWH